uniref:Uncharacterized protein n=1 Tax=Anguilla anguilla TaxID=7936 RepID=A0A0E9XR32_ANGAN
MTVNPEPRCIFLIHCAFEVIYVILHECVNAVQLPFEMHIDIWIGHFRYACFKSRKILKHLCRRR